MGAPRSINSSSKYPSLWLLAATIWLNPAAARAIDFTSTATGNGALATVRSEAKKALKIGHNSHIFIHG